MTTVEMVPLDLAADQPDTVAWRQPGAALGTEELAADLYVALADLPDRQRELLYRAYGLGGSEPQPFKAIAIDFGVSYARTLQIRDQAFRALRRLPRSRALRMWVGWETDPPRRAALTDIVTVPRPQRHRPPPPPRPPRPRPARRWARPHPAIPRPYTPADREARPPDPAICAVSPETCFVRVPRLLAEGAVKANLSVNRVTSYAWEMALRAIHADADTHHGWCYPCWQHLKVQYRSWQARGRP